MPFVDFDADLTEIPNPEPGKSYRWLNFTNLMTFGAHMRAMGGRPGYRLAGDHCKTRDELVKYAEGLGFNEAWIDEKNRIVQGDVVLAWIPKEEQARRRDILLKRQKAVAGVSHMRETFETAIDGLKAKGIRPVVREMAEHDDRKEFAERESQHKVSMARTNAQVDAEPTGGKPGK